MDETVQHDAQAPLEIHVVDAQKPGFTCTSGVAAIRKTALLRGWSASWVKSLPVSTGVRKAMVMASCRSWVWAPPIN